MNTRDASVPTAVHTRPRAMSAASLEKELQREHSVMSTVPPKDVLGLVQGSKSRAQCFAFTSYEKLRGAFRSFSSLETVVFEMPYKGSEDRKTRDPMPAFLKAMKEELDVYITYSYNVKSDRSIFIRFLMNSVVPKSEGAPVRKIGDSVLSGGPVMLYTRKASTLDELPPHSHLVCDSCFFSPSDEKEYILDFLTAAVFDGQKSAAKRVNELTINLHFEMGTRKKGNDLLAQWDNFVFILSRCKNCKCFCVTGASCDDMHSFLVRLRASLGGAKTPPFIFALFFEIHPSSVVSDTDRRETWRKAIGNGNEWVQRISRTPSGTTLVWCLQMTRKRKRAPIDCGN